MTMKTARERVGGLCSVPDRTDLIRMVEIAMGDARKAAREEALEDAAQATIDHCGCGCDQGSKRDQMAAIRALKKPGRDDDS